jgi:signal transduction histidine kinase
MTRPPRRTRIPRTFTSSFNRLETCVWWLRRLLILLLGVITVLPVSVFFFLEFSHSQTRIQLYARQFALLMSYHLEHPGSAVSILLPQLRTEMSNNHILFLQLLGEGDQELLRLGESQPQRLALTAKIPLSLPTPSLRAVAIQQDIRPLIHKVVWVFGIHLCVAALLALVVCRVPMRALHQAIDDVQAAQAQAIHADKLRAIGEAYAGLTHEINSPLSILQTRVKLLIDAAHEHQSPPDMIRDLEVIDRHGTRIADVLHGLLPFARKTPLVFVPTDLNQVIREAIALVEKPFAIERIGIETCLAPKLPTCLGSHNHLQQVFLNLLNNARDAMPKGGKITVRTSRHTTHIVAQIQDTGTGIAEVNHDRIFEPYFHHQKSGQRNGAGIGGELQHNRRTWREDRGREYAGTGCHLSPEAACGEVRS